MNTFRPELWMTLKGRDNYMVSNSGNVKTYHRQWRRWINKSVREDSKGYLTVGISSGTKSTSSARVHRLVAEAFIPNPNKLPYVNHKDNNPKNNDVSNLEWCDAKYNSRHSFFSGDRVSGYAIPVKLFVDGEFYSYYPSVEHCSKKISKNKKFFDVSKGRLERVDGLFRIEVVESIPSNGPINRDVLKSPIGSMSVQPILFGGTPYISISDFAEDMGITISSANWASVKGEYGGVKVEKISLSEYILAADLIVKHKEE